MTDDEAETAVMALKVGDLVRVRDERLWKLDKGQLIECALRGRVTKLWPEGVVTVEEKPGKWSNWKEESLTLDRSEVSDGREQVGMAMTAHTGDIPDHWCIDTCVRVFESGRREDTRESAVIGPRRVFYDPREPQDGLAAIIRESQPSEPPVDSEGEMETAEEFAERVYYVAVAAGYVPKSGAIVALLRQRDAAIRADERRKREVLARRPDYARVLEQNIELRAKLEAAEREADKRLETAANHEIELIGLRSELDRARAVVEAARKLVRTGITDGEDSQGRDYFWELDEALRAFDAKATPGSKAPG